VNQQPDSFAAQERKVSNSRITPTARLLNTRRLDRDVSERQRLSREKFKKYRDTSVEEAQLAKEDMKKHRE
jgi:hypothetical protein